MQDISGRKSKDFQPIYKVTKTNVFKKKDRLIEPESNYVANIHLNIKNDHQSH